MGIIVSYERGNRWSGRKGLHNCIRSQKPRDSPDDRVSTQILYIINQYDQA